MRLWNWIVLAGIIAIAVLSVITVWHSPTDRYLQDAIPWPGGQGFVEFPLEIRHCGATNGCGFMVAVGDASYIFLVSN